MAAKAIRLDSVPERPQATKNAPQAIQSAVQLDQLIHERVRLGIVSALATEKSLTFGELKEALDISDGNLSVHARKLEEAGYLECRKYFEGRRPQADSSSPQPGARLSRNTSTTWPRW